MNIRRATVADLPALLALNRTVHQMHAAAHPRMFQQDPPDELVKDAFTTALESPSSYWLVAEEGEVVAFLSAEFRQRAETWYSVSHQVCYISGIVVSSNYRRRGIARTLLAHLKRAADLRSVERIELDVWRFNDEARQAFARLGFQPVMERMTLSHSEPRMQARG